MSCLNAAVAHKTHLVVDHLPALLPSLYEETIVKPELVRQVKMGPWTVETDDGVSNRKTAYETMYTLLQNAFTKIDLVPFLARTIAGFKDDDDIKILCYLMIGRLMDLAPAQVSVSLDDMVDGIEVTMKDPASVKDATAQEIQRKEELQANALKTIIPLWKKLGSTSSPRFDQTVRSLAAEDKWKVMFKEYGIQV